MESDDDDNLYAAPRALTSIAPSRRSNGGLRWVFWWWVVFSFNLSFPLGMAWEITKQSGRIGIALATGVLFVSGLWAGIRNQEIRAAALTGGILVAFSQFIPVIHILAGGFALFAMGRLNTNDDASPTIVSEREGFLVTLIAGGLLILAAMVLGYIAREAWKSVKERRRGA